MSKFLKRAGAQPVKFEFACDVHSLFMVNVPEGAGRLHLEFQRGTHLAQTRSAKGEPCGDRGTLYEWSELPADFDPPKGDKAGQGSPARAAPHTPPPPAGLPGDDDANSGGLAAVLEARDQGRVKEEIDDVQVEAVLALTHSATLYKHKKKGFLPKKARLIVQSRELGKPLGHITLDLSQFGSAGVTKTVFHLSLPLKHFERTTTMKLSMFVRRFPDSEQHEDELMAQAMWRAQERQSNKYSQNSRIRNSRSNSHQPNSKLDINRGSYSAQHDGPTPTQSRGPSRGQSRRGSTAGSVNGSSDEDDDLCEFGQDINLQKEEESVTGELDVLFREMGSTCSNRQCSWLLRQSQEVDVKKPGAGHVAELARMWMLLQSLHGDPSLTAPTSTAAGDEPPLDQGNDDAEQPPPPPGHTRDHSAVTAPLRRASDGVESAAAASLHANGGGMSMSLTRSRVVHPARAPGVRGHTWQTDGMLCTCNEARDLQFPERNSCSILTFKSFLLHFGRKYLQVKFEALGALQEQVISREEEELLRWTIRAMWRIGELGKRNPFSSCAGKLRQEQPMRCSVGDVEVVLNRRQKPKHAKFVLKIETGIKNWTVRKRYSEVLKWYKKLKKCAKEVDLDLLPIPPKTFSLSRHTIDQKVISQRRQAFNDFFMDLTSPDKYVKVKKNPEMLLLVQQFLGVNLMHYQAMSRGLFHAWTMAACRRHTAERTLPRAVVEVLMELLMGRHVDVAPTRMLALALEATEESTGAKQGGEEPAAAAALGHFAQGKRFHEPFLLPTLFQALAAVSRGIAVDAMQSITATMLLSRHNTRCLQLREWQTLILPLLIPPPVPVLKQHEHNANMPLHQPLTKDVEKAAKDDTREVSKEKENEQQQGDDASVVAAAAAPAAGGASADAPAAAPAAASAAATSDESAAKDPDGGGEAEGKDHKDKDKDNNVVVDHSNANAAAAAAGGANIDTEETRKKKQAEEQHQMFKLSVHMCMLTLFHHLVRDDSAAKATQEQRAQHGGAAGMQLGGQGHDDKDEDRTMAEAIEGFIECVTNNPLLNGGLAVDDEELHDSDPMLGACTVIRTVLDSLVCKIASCEDTFLRGQHESPTWERLWELLAVLEHVDGMLPKSRTKERGRTGTVAAGTGSMVAPNGGRNRSLSRSQSHTDLVGSRRSRKNSAGPVSPRTREPSVPSTERLPSRSISQNRGGAPPPGTPPSQFRSRQNSNSRSKLGTGSSTTPTMGKLEGVIEHEDEVDDLPPPAMPEPASASASGSMGPPAARPPLSSLAEEGGGSAASTIIIDDADAADGEPSPVNGSSSGGGKSPLSITVDTPSKNPNPQHVPRPPQGARPPTARQRSGNSSISTASNASQALSQPHQQHARRSAGKLLTRALCEHVIALLEGLKLSELDSEGNLFGLDHTEVKAIKHNKRTGLHHLSTFRTLIRPPKVKSHSHRKVDTRAMQAMREAQAIMAQHEAQQKNKQGGSGGGGGGGGNNNGSGDSPSLDVHSLPAPTPRSSRRRRKSLMDTLRDGLSGGGGSGNNTPKSQANTPKKKKGHGTPKKGGATPRPPSKPRPPSAPKPSASLPGTPLRNNSLATTPTGGSEKSRQRQLSATTRRNSRRLGVLGESTKQMRRQSKARAAGHTRSVSASVPSSRQREENQASFSGRDSNNGSMLSPIPDDESMSPRGSGSGGGQSHMRNPSAEIALDRIKAFSQQADGARIHFGGSVGSGTATVEFTHTSAPPPPPAAQLPLEEEPPSQSPPPPDVPPVEEVVPEDAMAPSQEPQQAETAAATTAATAEEEKDAAPEAEPEKPPASEPEPPQQDSSAQAE